MTTMTQQASLFSTAPDTARQAIQLHQPVSQVAGQAVAHIEAALESVTVGVIGCSYGKDSASVLGLTLQASRNLARRGIHRRIVVVTSDTGVENPAVIRHAHRMAGQTLQWSTEQGLDVEQV
ncbi:hypothetical protein MELB17_09998 [Marinobacter sp. ELB17]|nr:hypothetical protein MELB17_09998 [Marinobacter sp. ELB17]